MVAINYYLIPYICLLAIEGRFLTGLAGKGLRVWKLGGLLRLVRSRSEAIEYLQNLRVGGGTVGLAAYRRYASLASSA